MIAETLGLTSFDPLPQLVAMLTAYFLALPIGWNRERAERSAGLRTFPLVAIAACGFVQMAEAVTVGSPEALARIVEGVIVGMGFIGGGAILKNGQSVRGTATAASLWVTGAMGLAVGLGHVDIAVILSLVTALTLYLLSPLKPDDRDEETRAEPKTEG